jgi:dolichol-phosphate mannosyltransferase
MAISIDIILPVYNEEKNILETITGIKNNVKNDHRILIIYDYDEDPTINVVKNITDKNILLIKNKYLGLNGAMKTAFELCDAKTAMFYSAEDHQNFGSIDIMFEKYKNGYQVVCGSRLIEGGDYNESSDHIVKKILVKIVSFVLTNFTSVNTKDPSNGTRLFSKEIIDRFPIKSVKGFTFSIELLAKAYRNNYKITEIPVKNPKRKFGESKFKLTSIFYYIPWFIHILLFKPKKINK